MYHAGMGHTHVESFLTTMEVPCLHHKTMKRREKEVAVHVRKVAEKSCEDVLEKEKKEISG